ncbi:MAG: OB-fold domain-containing protein [Gammaproteobacteria bacterium]|nr:OB-fold domain-containing protein [Gammaproteobacteria bacterium]
MAAERSAASTILTHPQFPGYQYPPIIIQVDLEEGTRVTSQLVGCEPAAVDFGLPVEMQIPEDAGRLQLPVFTLRVPSDAYFTQKQAAIAGIGCTGFSKKSGGVRVIARRAASSACDDAGISPREIDGLVSYTMDLDRRDRGGESGWCLRPDVLQQDQFGGGAAVGTIAQAAMAIATDRPAPWVLSRHERTLGATNGAGYPDSIISSDLVHGRGTWLTDAEPGFMGRRDRLQVHAQMPESSARIWGRVAISQRNRPVQSACLWLWQAPHHGAVPWLPGDRASAVPLRLLPGDGWRLCDPCHQHRARPRPETQARGDSRGDSGFHPRPGADDELTVKS